MSDMRLTEATGRLEAMYQEVIKLANEWFEISDEITEDYNNMVTAKVNHYDDQWFKEFDYWVDTLPEDDTHLSITKAAHIMDNVDYAWDTYNLHDAFSYDQGKHWLGHP